MKRRYSKQVPNCVPLTPDLEKSEDDPCWEGYVQLGMKPKTSSKGEYNMDNKEEKTIAKMLKKYGRVKTFFPKSGKFKGLTNFELSVPEYELTVSLYLTPEGYVAIASDLNGSHEETFRGNLYSVEAFVERSIDIARQAWEENYQRDNFMQGWGALDDISKYAGERNRRARFHEGPKGRKEFEKWKAEQPKEFQEEWDANTEEYGDKFKKARQNKRNNRGNTMRKLSRNRYAADLTKQVANIFKGLLFQRTGEIDVIRARDGQIFLEFAIPVSDVRSDSRTIKDIKKFILEELEDEMGSDFIKTKMHTLESRDGEARGSDLVYQVDLFFDEDGHDGYTYSKFAELSIQDYERMLTAKPQNQEIFESGATLSGVDPSLAKFFIEEGKADGDAKDDAIPVNKGSTKATKLKPSQSTMVPINSVGMALAMINGFMDTNLGAIISSDGQIMDGHHRWAGAILAYGSKAKVGGWFTKLKGKDLLRVLNTYTKGKYNRGGKSGQGNISDFKPSVVKEILEDGLVNGVTSTKGFHTKPELVEKALLQLGNGDVDAGIEIMSNNASMINKTVPGWAPKRKDMPVIEPNEVPEVANYMSKGLIDWAPPYKKASNNYRDEGPSRRRASSLKQANLHVDLIQQSVRSLLGKGKDLGRNRVYYSGKPLKADIEDVVIEWDVKADLIRVTFESAINPDDVQFASIKNASRYTLSDLGKKLKEVLLSQDMDAKWEGYDNWRMASTRRRG